MNHVTQIVIFLSSLILLLGCETTSHISPKNVQINQELYNDDAFNDFQTFRIETEKEVFAISSEMRDMVKEVLLPERNIKRRAKKLLTHIFDKETVNLAYQSTANLTAIDSYNSKIANCMSLTIMAYALAKEANLNVTFQDVKVPEYWVRNGQYNLLTGHVNLVISKPRAVRKISLFNEDSIEIDFDPYAVKKHFEKKVISKDIVLAMFYNNKGAQALVEQEYDLAYAYLKKATIVAPSFTSAWANLGILYKITENLTFAENAYRHAISIDKDNLNALSNLVLLLNSIGSSKEANQIDRLLNKKRQSNPYYHALLADEAYFAGDNLLAQKHYKKAIKLNNRIHEFYYGIAKVYFQLDEIELAQKSIKKAIKHNDLETTQDEYIAKLNFLKDVNRH